MGSSQSSITRWLSTRTSISVNALFIIFIRNYLVKFKLSTNFQKINIVRCVIKIPYRPLNIHASNTYLQGLENSNKPKRQTKENGHDYGKYQVVAWFGLLLRSHYDRRAWRIL